jgi:hypothetical protein
VSISSGGCGFIEGILYDCSRLQRCRDPS